MWHLLVPICLAIFSSTLSSASEPHYVITVPSILKQGTEEKACVTFLDLKGEVDIKIELKHDDQVHIVAEDKINTHDHYKCYTFQLPLIKDLGEEWELHVSAHGENINVDQSKKVRISRRHDVCIIQSDKSTYKPGDTVKFRLVTVNDNFQAISKQYPLVELLDARKNRIAQWLDVSTEQGFADFNFHLAKELVYGQYTIRIGKECEKSFTVDKYELKRFQFDINVPSDLHLTDKSIHVEACGRYTFGKPVEGKIDLSVCGEVQQRDWQHRHQDSNSEEEEGAKTNCIDIKGEKTDSKGCISRDIDLGHFKFATSKHNQYLEIKSELTEDNTGHSEKSSVDAYFNRGRKTIEFVECDHIYQKGFPYHGKVKISDEKKQPMVNEAIYIISGRDEATRVNLVTDANGIAQFTLNTSEWESYVFLQALFSSDDHDNDGDEYLYYDVMENWKSRLYLSPFYSTSESILSIQKHSEDIPCNSDQSVLVEYDIHKKNLESDTDHLHFFYILMTKSGMSSYKEHTVNIKDQATSTNLHGSFPLNFHVGEDFFPTFSLLVFSILPNGETVAWTAGYFVSACVQNKMKLSFSEEQVRPGESVNLEVTADAGSMCSVRSVDKGYLLDKPHEDDYRLTDMSNEFRSAFSGPPGIYYAGQEVIERHECPENMTAEYDDVYDAYRLFRMKNLHILTNTQIKIPVKCVSHEFYARSSVRKKSEHKDAGKDNLKYFTRSYFPDTWLYEIVPVGSDGHAVLNRTTPHTITKWVTDAFCLTKTGLAKIKDIELTTFQPYFIDLIVPYSVVQGERFTIEAVVFSYAKKCILIAVSLSDSEDLISVKDKEQARCVCEGNSHSFSWDVSALKPKELKIHVDSGSVEVVGECTPGALQVGDDHRKDSVEKTVLVKPKGYEDEKSKTFILFPSDKRDNIAFNIETPERLVAGSERAHIIIQGDIMANIFINLDELTYLPDGCGEQNTAKFSRYVYTLEYLESIKGLTPEQKATAIETLVQIYQKQLTFRNENGAFAFYPGSQDNSWITAMTVKILIGAQQFVYINENHIQQAVNWLHSQQLSTGCFSDFGPYFNNYQEADDDVTRTAYVTSALLEHPAVYNVSIVGDALSCLKKSVDNATSVYSQALMAYVFTLSGDSELRDQLLKKLDEKAVEEGGMKHWETSWSETVETASYVVLALLSEKLINLKNMQDSVEIIRWIVTQQNAWGGFQSSQDTAVALQALAKFAKVINNRKGDVTVTIRSKSGFEKTVHVDKSNSLLVQTVDLPEIPGEYTASITGNGFVYLQSHSHYNVLPEKTGKGPFSFNISTEPSACTHASQKQFDVHLDVKYTGKRENTNMAMIILETVSGYVPDKDSVKKLKKHPLVDRTEISAHNISIYLSKLTHEPVHLVFSLEQEAYVENLQAAPAVVLDYYDPDEYTVVEYSAPCSSVEGHCAVAAAEREDCGFPSISKEQCEQKGCCFDSSVPGSKWCFFQGFKKTENH